MGRWDGYVKTQKPCTNASCTNLVWKGKYCAKCKQRLRRHGDINIVLPKHRTYFFNENLMDSWTKESAWVFGWILTDGCINDSFSPQVRIQLKDKEPLEIIQKLFKHSGELSCQLDKYWTFRAHSVKLVNKLKELGITTNKSLTVGMPSIPEDVFSHFVRGVVEGDGSIVEDKTQDRLFVYINSASKDFIEQLSKRLLFKHKLRVFAESRRKNYLYRLVFWGKVALDLCNWIYTDSEGLRLTRKYERFIKHGH